MEQKPSVGRIVHYVSLGSKDGKFESECRAAIVTSVGVNNQVSLTVFNPNGMYLNECSEHSEEAKGGTWHWPEKV